MTYAWKIIKTQNLIIFVLFIVILFYSFFIGEIIPGVIGIILLVILSGLIQNGTDKPVKNPLLWIISIIIMAYFFDTGEWLWGLIAVVQITILWILAYRLLHREKEKQNETGKRATGITIIAVLYSVDVFFGIFEFISEPTAVVLGVKLFGVSAQVVLVIYILAGIYIAYGFFKLKKLAWKIAIISAFYVLLNMSINIISYGSYLSSGIIVPIFGLFLNIIIILYLLEKAGSFRN